MASASEILKAYLHCARTPAEDAVERIRTQLKKQYGAAEVELTVSVEPDLISGYVLQVGDRVFDNSGKSALAAITAAQPGCDADPCGGLQARRHDRRGRHRDLRSRRRCGRQGHGSGRLR